MRRTERHGCASAPAASGAAQGDAGPRPARGDRLHRARVHLGRRLYVRIYLAVLASLVLAALLIGAVVHLTADERPREEAVELVAQAVAELLPPSASPAAQRLALARWAERAQATLGLFDAQGQPLEATGPGLPAPQHARSAGGWQRGAYALRLPDGRWLVAAHARTGSVSRASMHLLEALALVALAVALAAWPLVRRLTLGLERLQASVEALGAGDFAARVPVRGHDEVARLAHSFNAAAERIQTLVRAQQSLLANASHELRSPLARIRMAVEAAGGSAAARAEAARSIGELDALIDEILLASRLEATAAAPYPFEPVDLAGLAAECCAQAGAELAAVPVTVHGHAGLLRRLLRNLLDNAQRHAGGAPAEVRLTAEAGAAILQVNDRGPGVPPAERERVFEPFYRLPGASERAGGVGLGLALVRQIAQRHGGTVQCRERAGGGSTFELRLPLAAPMGSA